MATKRLQLLGKFAGSSESGVGIESVEQTTTSNESGGTNVITVTLTDGSQSTFAVQNGSKGDKGETGATGPKGDKGDTGATGPKGIQGENGVDGTSVTIESKTESSEDGGSNVVKFSDGTTISIKNGSKGSKGETGATGPKGDTGETGPQGVSGVYVGSGSMPAGYNIQIDPESDDKTVVGSDEFDLLVNDVNRLEEQKADKENVIANTNNIVGLQKTMDDILSLKAQGDTLEEQLVWLAENGDTTKEYLCVDGYYYEYVYKEGEPLYTNLLPLATDSDRETILNGVGYKTGYRLNSSGLEKELSGCQVSGYNDCKYGDTIRIKNLEPYTEVSYNHVIGFYDDSNTFLGSTYLQPPASGNSWGTDHGKGVSISSDLTTFTIDSGNSSITGITNCTAFRFMGTNMENVIVTVNQEIVEGTTEGAYSWENTGRSNSSTNYENRISAIENAIKTGEIGGKLEIVSIEESTEDGGENIVTFSDGSTLTIKNGLTGSRGSSGTNGQDGTVQIEPLFAESVTWLDSNGDTSKLYILPDNFTYAYINGTWKNTGNLFTSSDRGCQKYVNDRNTYIMSVPGGYCESKVEYNTNGTHYLSKYDFATMTSMFSALTTSNPDYVTETLLGKDSTNTYEIKKYVLDAPTAISDGYDSAMSREKPTFIITSGLHGVEPDAVHMVYHFMEDLCENYMESDQLEYLRNNVKFVIVPISNPWGYVNQSYYNSNDVDLNKNFAHGYQTNGTDNTGIQAYSEVETQYLKSVFDAHNNAVFHLECHGKYGEDTSFSQTIWFSLMRTLNSDLIELCAEKITSQIGRRLYKMGYETNKSVGGYITYYGTNGRPKDYTGTEYGMLSATMEGTGKIYGTSGYSIDTQKINCEALENFVLRVLDALNSRVEI